MAGFKSGTAVLPYNWLTSGGVKPWLKLPYKLLRVFSAKVPPSLGVNRLKLLTSLAAPKLAPGVNLF